MQKRKTKKIIARLGAEINVKHKDSLFRLIFGREENKSYLLELYNALTGNSYKNINDLTINTLENAIYMKMKNDVSFLLDSKMVLFEHQSTFNPNMPLRGLFYFSTLYHSYVDSREDADIYGSKLIKIPTPQYVIFYNGLDCEQKDKITLKLSDAFEQPDKGHGFEWTATMLNVNFGQNVDLMNACKPLKGYSVLVCKIRKYSNELGDIKTAVDKAIDECIIEGYLVDFLKKHRAEVQQVCLYRYDEEKHLRLLKQDVYKEGYDSGYDSGKNSGKSLEKIETIKRMLSMGFTKEQILQATLCSEKDIQAVIL